MKRRDNIFRPDRRILSPEDAAREAENPSERSPIAPRQRVPGNPLHDYVTREELIKGCSNAAIAVGDRMYEQMSEETGQYLREMEMDLRGVIADEVRLAFERQTLRYRLRFLWYRWFPGKPTIVAAEGDVVSETGEVIHGEAHGNAEVRGVRDGARGDLPERPSGDGPREDVDVLASVATARHCADCDRPGLCDVIKPGTGPCGQNAGAEGAPDISPPAVREVPETLHPDGA